MKVYYPESSLAPYLQVREPSFIPNSTTSNGTDEEADAGAGFSKRVTSLGNLWGAPRSNSESQLLHHPTTKPTSTNDSQAATSSSNDYNNIVPDWRVRDRLKTMAVGLIVTFNKGDDPPDVVRPQDATPMMQCWTRPRRGETIVELLEQQYKVWQPGRGAAAATLSYRKCVDPTLQDFQDVCLRLRKDAKRDRVLWHYNGHGVPQPTKDGEVWVFDRGHSKYQPCSVVEIRKWLGAPSMVVLDCSNAGVLIPFFCNTSTASATTMEELASLWVRDVVVLCPCSQNEVLPMHPDYPADIFTACLTTPIRMALRWFVLHHPVLGLHQDAVDHIPGQASDRKTPLGEIRWIFQAVTDSIAWDAFPKPLFQRLFRQDLLTASMFRNFLLADRILRSFNCTPQSMPPLPPGISKHILWEAWDLACEKLLFQLKNAGVFNHLDDPEKQNFSDDTSSFATDSVVTTPSQPVTISLPFFDEQLTSLEVWLDYAELYKKQFKAGAPMKPPEQLPVILQGIIGATKDVRIRSLELLRRFVNLGPQATNHALCLAIIAYIIKLLGTPECKSTLVRIWASILSFDPSCRAELCKNCAFVHFTSHLMFGLNTTENVPETQASQERTTAAFILAIACFEYPVGQTECVRLDLHNKCCALLSSYEPGENHHDRVAVDRQLPAHFRLWLCICLANLVKDNTAVQIEAYAAGAAQRLKLRLNDPHPHVRASACYALGCLIGSAPKRGTPSFQDLNVISTPTANLPHQRLAQPPSFLSNMGQPPGNMVVGPMMRLSRPQFASTAGLPVSPPERSLLWNQQQSYVLSSGLVLSQPAPGQQFPSFGHSDQQASSVPSPRGPSVYQERERLAQDLNTMKYLLDGVNDASSVVRFEATVALGTAVEKYLDAFVVVAHEYSGHSALGAVAESDTLEPPHGVEEDQLSNFLLVWKSLRKLQHEDHFRPINEAATAIVRVVHDTLWQVQREKSSTTYRSLAGIEEGNETGGVHLPQESGIVDRVSSSLPGSKASNIRRISSEVIPSDTFPEERLQAFDNPSRHQPDSPSYMFPKSDFYDWMKKKFDPNFEIPEDVTPDSDPLSLSGATFAYQQHRNKITRQHSFKLASQFLGLYPKSKIRQRKFVDTSPPDDQDTLAKEEEMTTALKRDIQMKVKHSFCTEGAQKLQLLEFHPFEDCIVSCSGTDDIAVWRTETRECRAKIKNGNPDKSRMTSACWINEETNSLFLLGCNDGSIRIWGDLVASQKVPYQPPKLVTAFEAEPMEASPSGRLIVEWQRTSGKLVTGGSFRHLKCWDLESEKEANRLETNKDAYVTTLTKVWDSDKADDISTTRKFGISPDLILAGHTDGVLQVFDIRTRGVVSSLHEESHMQRKRFYSEHSNWVVSTHFACYGGRYEIISGTVAGEVKAWDLRMAASIRTVQAQRSSMTAFSVHGKIPIIATGAEQFLKVMSVGGEPIQVIRCFDSTHKQSVGPISSLAFHPYKPLLAAGSADGTFGVFGANGTANLDDHN